ncbi:hypothetical protein C4K26_4824 [Pseudomonas chlororaphis]|nr:hypothetical protein C4K26_4824 [Pseudomonas chlororaphis]
MPGQLIRIKTLIFKAIKYLWRVFPAVFIRLSESTRKSRSENRMPGLSSL